MAVFCCFANMQVGLQSDQKRLLDCKALRIPNVLYQFRDGRQMKE